MFSQQINFLSRASDGEVRHTWSWGSEHRCHAKRVRRLSSSLMIAANWPPGARTPTSPSCPSLWCRPAGRLSSRQASPSSTTQPRSIYLTDQRERLKVISNKLQNNHDRVARVPLGAFTMVLICTIIITIIRVAKVRLGASTMVLGCTRTLSTAGRDIWSVFLSTYQDLLDCSRHWLLGSFLFGTEIGGASEKNHPVRDIWGHWSLINCLMGLV